MTLSPYDLIGRVAARRLRNLIDGDRGRAFLCIMGLDAPVVTAIARHVAAETSPSGHIEVYVHPGLVEGDVGAAEVSDKTAPWHRNHAKPGVRLTLCTVPPDQVKAIGPTLAHSEKIEDGWLMHDAQIWAQEGIKSADTIQDLVKTALEGLTQAQVAHDALSIARYVTAVDGHINGGGGLKPDNALRAALPMLRLPRDAGDANAKLTMSPTAAAQFFIKALDETQPALYLKSRDGDPLNPDDLKRRLRAFEDEKRLEPQVIIALDALLNDRQVYDGTWTPTQAAVAELGWDRIESFFIDAKRSVKPTFGKETQQLFDRQFPAALTEDEKKLLEDLTRERRKSNTQIDDFFYRHRARLQTDVKLYKRWERLVFQAPIEVEDLTEGLLRLTHRAAPEGDDFEEEAGDRTLVIRLRGGEKLDLWTRDKNTRVLRFLRDRYRGLPSLLEPHALLDCGRCWTGEWDGPSQEEVVSRSRTAVELEFEAFLVPRGQAEMVRASIDAKPHPNRAQLIWKPPPEAIGLALSQDLRQIRPQEAKEVTRLLTGRVRQNRAARAAQANELDLRERTSINDAHGQSEGVLANPGATEHRIDISWPAALASILADGVIAKDKADELSAHFEAFTAAYGRAIDDLLRGDGLGAPSLVAQAERYADLLRAVPKLAPQRICLRNLLAPLLGLGVIAVDGERPAALVAAWQPLRLAELSAKAHQLSADIAKVIAANAEQRSNIEDFVLDRAFKLGASFYADVALLPGDPSRLLAETQALADCSLLESVANHEQYGISDEPADAAVQAFDRVASEYLNLRPHEESNFSVVILNADSENLPLAMANGLARRIEDSADLRCELVVTDDNPNRLRHVYERQNRRISMEMDTSLTSEATRSFLSRLRLGILSPELLNRGEGLKASDVVLLQDVIARKSVLHWISGAPSFKPPNLLASTPSERSRRRPFEKGATTSALYLTAPYQPAAAQAYVDSLFSVTRNELITDGAPRLPVREVEFTSGDVARVLKTAHELGAWVMTFDRVADRRLITSDARRIIRYFSAPGSTHNVIVSTEITEEELETWISKDVDAILPGLENAPKAALRHELFTRAAQLSGGIVMRGAQWGNYAHELLGLVLTQRELERLLTVDRESRTGWFFLDDYRDFLDLTGEMADILAIDFSRGSNGREIRLLVAEAKYTGRDSLGEQRKRSFGQLESTYMALHHRLLDPEASLDPTIWRNRLADMVLEHMEPFDQVGGWSQGAWLEALRCGEVPLRLEGYSLVFSHDAEPWAEVLPALADETRPAVDRRRMAQWAFPRSVTAQAMRDLPHPDSPGLIERPRGWPPAADTTPISAPDQPAQDPSPSELLKSLPLAPEVALLEPEAPASSIGADVPVAELVPLAHPNSVPPGLWSQAILSVLHRLSRSRVEANGETWLAEQIVTLRGALQAEGMDAPVQESRLTPNTGLIYVGGRALTISWLERRQTDLLTRYGLDIVRITPLAGRIAIGLRRPTRAILHLADAWLRRAGDAQDDAERLAPLLGEKEDDGALCFLPLAKEFAGQEVAAPHSVISGTTGSGKGILVTNLILDFCALNSPRALDLYLIDPKRGVDYAWARKLPHMKAGIIDDQSEALAWLSKLVDEMDVRYEQIAAEGCRNIDHFNRKVGSERQLPRIVIFFDEVANWMQDDEFKSAVDGLINKIATKARAAGFHLFMIYQRADNQVMTMQLRTNLGNKLILRLGDEGSSKIALGERGAERLLGKGHLIGKLGTDEKVYMQVPYIGDEEVDELAEAIIATWTGAHGHSNGC